MSTNSNRARGRGRGGRNNNRGGRGGGRGGGKTAFGSTLTTEANPAGSAPETVPETSATKKIEDDASQDDLCWICANPVVYYSVGPCNHRTCHVCALRLRALYKNQKCAFCKEDQPTLIFTSSAEQTFSEYAPEAIPYKDAKLNISFETEQMMEETLILLRFNCPDSSCDYVARGWGDLGLHARSVHGRVMCDLCIANKKVFAHEHTLYTSQQLSIHLPEGKRRGPKNARSGPDVENKDGDQPHPACLFCQRCYFGPDELYKHMRELHEDCFICKRDNGSSEYFLDYPSLERHFDTAHHPCPHPTCQAAKFVVFGSQLDLRAHVVEEHAGDMSAAGVRDARRVEFDFEEVGGRRGRGRGRGGPSDRGGGRGASTQTEREPPPNRGPSGGGVRRREGFGTSLTSGNEETSQLHRIQPAPSFAQTPAPNQAAREHDPAVLTRHTDFLNLLASKATRPNSAVPSVKSAIRGWKSGESSSRDLISLIHTVVDENLENTAAVINSFARLLDEDEDDDAEERRRDLLKEWRGFEVEQKRQFPSLVPTFPQDGSSSSSNRGGTTAYAAVTGGRAILNAKHHTATSGRKQGNIWSRVEQAASSSNSLTPAPRPGISRSVTPNSTATSSFPPLGVSSAGPSGSSNTRSTPWASSSSAASRPSSGLHVGSRAAPAQQQHKAPKLSSQELFPSLAPSSASTGQREKPKVSGNVSLRNILGAGPPPASQWGNNNGSSAVATNGNDGASSDPQNSGRPGKKGKGKQTLFTLGSFPT